MRSAREISRRRSMEGSLRGFALALLLGLASLTGGCDSGPSGPGEFEATLEATSASLGGVVLEVVGRGIEGFSGSGGTRVLWAATDEENVYRVVAINQVAGTIRFRVSVQDVGGDRPTANLINLVDGDNDALPITQDFKVAFTR